MGVCTNNSVSSHSLQLLCLNTHLQPWTHRKLVALALFLFFDQDQ